SASRSFAEAGCTTLVSRRRPEKVSVDHDKYRYSATRSVSAGIPAGAQTGMAGQAGAGCGCPDRKSTGLNSSHVSISYAVFCLKKKIHFSGPRSLVISQVQIRFGPVASSSGLTVAGCLAL